MMCVGAFLIVLPVILLSRIRVENVWNVVSVASWIFLVIGVTTTVFSLRGLICWYLKEKTIRNSVNAKKPLKRRKNYK